MDRRNFFGMISTSAAGLALVGCGSDAMNPLLRSQVDGDLLPFNEDWDYRATQLESQGVIRRGQALEGQEQNLVDQHLPQLVINEGKLIVSVNHEMEPGHWITTIYAKDEYLRVFALREFLSSESQATVEFNIPENVKKIQVYAFCNIHQNWCEEITV